MSAVWDGGPFAGFSFSDVGVSVESHRGGLCAQPHARGSTMRKHLRYCLEEGGCQDGLEGFIAIRRRYDLGNRDWYPWQ